MDQDRIRARRERREAFLRALYAEVDGSVSDFVDGFQIAAGVGADGDEARRIMAYFEEKGFLLVDDHKTGVIRITATGVDVVETAAG
jgi:hypothetical protein